MAVINGGGEKVNICIGYSLSFFEKELITFITYFPPY